MTANPSMRRFDPVSRGVAVKEPRPAPSAGVAVGITGKIAIARVAVG